MSEMPFNQLVPDPTMKQLLDLFRRDLMIAFNCHAIGTIEDFDSGDQRASISINYTKTFLQANELGVYRQVQQNYPTLVSCPVIVLQGGDAALTFPVAKGDTCLVLFNDRDMDNWLISGQVGSVNTQRLHSFADGIALVGLRAFNNALSDYDESHVRLYKGSTQVRLGAKIKLSNPTASLGEIVTALDTALNAFAGALSGASDPVVIAAGAALATAMTPIIAKVAGLLE